MTPKTPPIGYTINSSRPSRVHYPLISLPAEQQFRRVLSSLLVATMTSSTVSHSQEKKPHSSLGLKKIPPYWYPYTTMAKQRWLGREILEVVSTEFRDRSMEYYRYALESGVCTINGKVAHPETIVRNGDRIENIVHRHEPPVTSRPVKIIHRDEEREFIVIDKPGSIPVHATGRYYKNSLIEILRDEFGVQKAYCVNRLDRLTSGLMIIPTSSSRANELAKEFAAGTVRKEYIARVLGKFPEDEITCEEPLLTVDRQMGLNIVHPEGKPAKTVFKRLHYDENTDTSVIHCRPFTGRSHQLRVHLQFLGHPIANDPVYSTTKIWGENLGKGGIDITPSDERSAPQAPPGISNNTEVIEVAASVTENQNSGDASTSSRKALPRETGEDIGMGSPVPLSAEAVKVITNLRNLKDEDEDWSRWRDVIFRARGKLHPGHIIIPPPPPQNKRKRGGPVAIAQAEINSAPNPDASKLSTGETAVVTTVGTDNATTSQRASTDDSEPSAPEPPQLSTEEALSRLNISPNDRPPITPDPAEPKTEMSYCPECYLPIHPDPKPERLYIFLHALRYTTSLGCFETEMPEWAAEGWEWDRS
ncbi:tRNA-pseudouridine synthase [Panus rudis PR-1116 ss-1]|nr:tRNA-pseudouridine synthase [Panus rudis PR-1116 ss-1]